MGTCDNASKNRAPSVDGMMPVKALCEYGARVIAPARRLIGKVA